MPKKALGKGLDALFSGKEREASVPIKDKRFLDIPVELIDPNPFQPRETFTKEAMENLVISIKERGLLQPITVQKNGSRFQLIAGERRLNAIKILGRKTVPAYMLEFFKDIDLLEAAIIENVQRESLDPVELAVSFKRLADDFGLSHEEIARKVQKDRTVVTNHLRLLKLPVEIRLALKRGEISAGHARPLLSLKNEAQQISLFKKIVRDGMSVRKVEKAVKSILESADKPAQKEVPADPYLEDVAGHLRNILGTKITIKKKKKGGVIEVEYYSAEELERLVEMLEEIES